MKDSERQELYKLIGRNIGRYLKGFKSMSQANFVEEIGMGNRATLSNIIAGRQQVSIHLLFDIAKGLNLNPSDLLPSIEEIEQNIKNENIQYNSILEKHDVSQKDQDLILGLIDTKK